MAKRAATGKALVVVESPTKVKTIKKYLDPKFVVKASLGHVRDLPASKLGVDIENNFKPQYVVLRSKSKVLEELKKAAKGVERVYVATDPDREGEAIGWQRAQEPPVRKDQVYRVLFNEITEKAVKAAFTSPGKIDLKKVDAQQARRVLDRLVGYKLSPLLWEKVQRGLSAGRGQSGAVRLGAGPPPEFLAFLREKDGEKVSLASEADVQVVTRDLAGISFVVKAVTKGERRRNPAPPFITSTLQQEAGRKLRFSASRTMMVAQQLYEGVEVGAEGPTGLITYMRTDSPRVAAEAQAEARDVIASRFGQEYLPERPPVYRARKSAQEAHECVRPTSPHLLPQAVASALTKDQLALYKLIWERFMASQMTPALYDTVSVDVAAGPYIFRAQ